MIFKKRCIGVPGWQKNGFESLWSDPEGVYEQYTFYKQKNDLNRFPGVPRGSPGIPGTPGGPGASRGPPGTPKNA